MTPEISDKILEIGTCAIETRAIYLSNCWCAFFASPSCFISSFVSSQKSGPSTKASDLKSKWKSPLATLLSHLLVSSHVTRVRLEPTAAGRGSSNGSVFAWHASGPEFDPYVRHIISWRLGHENISTAILPLPLIQEESCQLLAKECALSTG